MANTILIVEDEPEIRDMLSDFLSRRGYRPLLAESAEAARTLLKTESVDLALLDITLPGEDGLSLARHLRENHSVAIIMLTALDSVVDRIVGLEVGADDYVAKPFDPRELLARIKNVLRRMLPPAAAVAEGHVAIGGLRLDTAGQKLLDAKGDEIPLTGGEYALLKVFVDNPGRVLTRDRILDLTQQREWDPFDRSVDIRVTRVRKKIEPNPEKPVFIRTVRGSGYKFVPQGE
ncbi:response regulator [Methylomonas sp. SURF-2]|uniref:Response regulator n=1 Tax=Methylomonas subterranea TaxID=2952225 RepID=A0ABT1TJM9_9GAMM|nr:response regulator [Methylomonas sp. SURF-2]MCQ8105272.1 response regulator [Methylomonas sp. SURF-2]